MKTPISGLPKEDRLLFSVLILVLLIVCYCTFPRIFTQSMWPDEALYAWLAKKASLSPQVLFSKEFIERHPPLFPLLLSAAQWIQPFSDAVVRAIVVSINIVGIVASFYVGWLIGGSVFLAAVCAVGVGLSLAFLVYIPRILSDGAMMTFFLFFILALFKAKESRSWFPHVLVGFFGVCLLLLKWSGLLCFPVLLICYLIPPNPAVRKRVFIPTSMILVTLGLLLWNNLHQLKTLLPNLTALQGAIFTGPPWFYVENFRLICSFFGGPILVLLGFLVLWKMRHPQRVLISAWFWVSFLVISLAGEKDCRYTFVFLPPMILSIGILFEYLAHTFIKAESARRLFLLAFCGCYLVSSFNFFVSRLGPAVVGDYAYVGFREAGHYIRSLKGPCLKVLAQSDRAIRYYSGIQYQEFGGQLSVLPHSIGELRETVSKCSGMVVMVIDYWEYTQPTWAYPLDINKLTVIENAGFRLVKVVNKAVPRDIQPDSSLVIQPVVWIFIANGGQLCRN
jgi:hypothetical protein